MRKRAALYGQEKRCNPAVSCCCTTSSFGKIFGNLGAMLRPSAAALLSPSCGIERRGSMPPQLVRSVVLTETESSARVDLLGYNTQPGQGKQRTRPARCALCWMHGTRGKDAR